MSYYGKVLTVDDQVEDLEIMNHILKKNNYETVSARDGVEALEVLNEQTTSVDVIVIDRMMPKMDGISFIRRLREFGRFKDIPVIMQTAANEDHQVMEGIDAGVYWYIIKPYAHNMLSTLVKSALRTNRRNRKIYELTDFYIESRKKFKGGMNKLNEATFNYKTLDEAKDIAHTLAISYSEPRKMVGPISELLINAVEHGNLCITYHEKNQLIMEGGWDEEIEYRLNHEDYSNKKVEVKILRDDYNLFLTIKDQGMGFDCTPYLFLEPERAFKASGRGIYLASLGFDAINYIGNGNEVVCRKSIS